MTHSLHRCGDKQSLKNDYVFLCTPAKGINNHGAAEKLKKVLDIVMDIGPSNIGFYGHGSILSDISINRVKRNFHDNSRIRCGFDDKEKLKKVLKRVKDENIGLSVTVSGLISELKELSKELKIQPHTINISCGVFGKVDCLPTKEVMEISTMCGHGMIANRLVTKIVKELQKGKLDIDKAVCRIGEPCTCGIFNPTRAKEILMNIAYKQDVASS